MEEEEPWRRKKSLGGGGSRDLQEEPLSGINPGKSHGQGPWVSWRRHRLDDRLVGKQEDTLPARYIDCGEVTRMPGQMRSWLGLQVVYDFVIYALPLLAFI